MAEGPEHEDLVSQVYQVSHLGYVHTANKRKPAAVSHRAPPCWVSKPGLQPKWEHLHCYFSSLSMNPESADVDSALSSAQ